MVSFWVAEPRRALVLVQTVRHSADAERRHVAPGALLRERAARVQPAGIYELPHGVPGKNGGAHAAMSVFAYTASE